MLHLSKVRMVIIIQWSFKSTFGANNMQGQTFLIGEVLVFLQTTVGLLKCRHHRFLLRMILKVPLQAVLPDAILSI